MSSSCLAPLPLVLVSVLFPLLLEAATLGWPVPFSFGSGLQAGNNFP